MTATKDTTMTPALDFTGMADRMIHNIESCRDRFNWARKEYMAARKEYDSNPSENTYAMLVSWEGTFNRAKERLNDAYDWHKANPGN